MNLWTILTNCKLQLSMITFIIAINKTIIYYINYSWPLNENFIKIINKSIWLLKVTLGLFYLRICAISISLHFITYLDDSANNLFIAIERTPEVKTPKQMSKTMIFLLLKIQPNLLIQMWKYINYIQDKIKYILNTQTNLFIVLMAF